LLIKPYIRRRSLSLTRKQYIVIDKSTALDSDGRYSYIRLELDKLSDNEEDSDNEDSEKGSDYAKITDKCN